VSAADLAINGGPRVREVPFPPWPVPGDDDAEAVTEALRSGRLTQLTGSTVAEFENAFAKWHGVPHAVATSSGTTAIHTALAALDVGPGDEVIVPAHTFIASATPVLHQRATPVFADVDERTFCIDPGSVEERLTDRTKAIAHRMRRIRHHGEGPMEGERAYFHVEPGYNYRMSSIHAATGLVQLRRLDEYLEVRRRNAAYISDRLGELSSVESPYVADGCVHSYYKYICRLRPEAGIDIAEFVRAVAAEGVPISRRYPTPLHRQPVFAGLDATPCPIAERIAGELFTLLVHPTVTTADLDDAVEAISKVLAG
jgi:dTDP-4-amino-4,6-dideoxygalactose transaminase